jgi:bifunctional enzyme CysN/CysC
MAPRSDNEALGLAQFLESIEARSLLRFITCGSVDDGKSTLIGRLLYESKTIFDDHLSALAADSKKHGTQGDALDFALLVDGLAAEREQGITIDVAYRYFSTERRKFIVADTPGHEQYTRNMVTGASTADAAVLLVDARNGLLTQTRRHSFLVSLIGIRHVALAINKMDLVDYSREVFERIAADYREFAASLGFKSITPIPISALRGDGILTPSAEMPWFAGPSLLRWLEDVEVEDERLSRPFRLPVQLVSRPNSDFRGFAGSIASGRIACGDRVRVLPSGRESRIARILIGDREATEAVAGEAVTLTLRDELDIARGDVIAAADAAPEVADQFEATLVWMAEEPMLPGRPYWLKLGARTVSATVTDLKYTVNVDSLEHLAAKTLGLNAIGTCNLNLSQPVAADPYTENRETGGFVLIDRASNATVGAGLVHFALRRSQNVHWQAIDIDKAAHAALKSQQGCILWFTGLSGAGKSTIANLVERRLHASGRHTYLLDGDNVRHGLNKDLGFTDADRVENIRRIAEVARLMVDAGLIVLTSFISPFRSERQMARELVEDGEFIEIFVDAPLALAEMRDPKGLYKKARRGELKNFTGIDSPYEPPEKAEIVVRTDALSATAAAEQIARFLLDRRIIDAI